MKVFRKIFGIITALVLVCSITSCQSSTKTDEALTEPEPITTAAIATTEVTATRLTVTTTTSTNVAATTTTTTIADGTPVLMPIKDISDADIRISNPVIFPQFFEPSAEVKSSVAEALKNAEWSAYVHKYPDHKEDPSPYDDLGIINIRYNDDMVSLGLYSDGHITVRREGEAYGKYHISQKSMAALSDAFYSYRDYGNELYVNGNNTEFNKDFWESEITEPVQNRYTSPFGDLSNAYICMTDTGCHPWVYVPTDIQKKLISDYLNAEEWVELPDDAEPKIYGNTSAPDLYINNNGQCFVLYVDMGYILYNDGNIQKKYDTKGAYFITASVLHTMLLDMGHYRLIDTGSGFAPYGQEPWDNAKWDRVISIIAEHEAEWKR